MTAFVPVQTGYTWVTTTIEPEDNEILSPPERSAIVAAFVAADEGVEGFRLIHDDATFQINVAVNGSVARFQYLPASGDPVTAVIVCIGT